MIVFYLLAGLIVTLLIVAALMPKAYHVEKAIVIKKPAANVQSKITDFNAYSTWNPWQKMEPSAAKNITGNPGSPGHKYEWVGKKIGTGSLTLKEVDDKHVHIALRFVKPWKTMAKDNWVFEPWGDGSETKVTWQNSGDLPWPIGRLMGKKISQNLNHQFGIGLDNLKKMCEVG